MINDDRAGESSREHDAFAERIAAPLRAPERLDDTFEARVMSAIHAEQRAEQAPNRETPGWWRRRRTVQTSPLAVLAAAAALAGVVAFGTASLQSIVSPERAGSATVTAATADTVHIVRFVYFDRAAEGVSLVADFNNWTKDEIRMDPGGEPGYWTASVRMPAGRHEYAFVVRTEDAERWAVDPSSVTIRDEFGTETSYITVGSDAASHQGSVTS